MSMDARDSNGARQEEPLNTRIAHAAGMLIRVLHELRVLQPEAEIQHGSKSTELNVLRYAASCVRMALGDAEMIGLLDFAGIQQVQGWLDQAVLDGRYLSQGESYDIYRFDTDHDPLYSSPALNIDDTSFWHKSIDAVVLHLARAIGAAPGGTYQFIPVTVRGA